MSIEKKNLRLIILTAVIVLLFAGYSLRLVSLQLVHGADYQRLASAAERYAMNAPAARGEIYDRNGVPLVYNAPSNSLVFTYAYFPHQNAQRNEVILSLIRLFEANGQPWLDPLPIVLDEAGQPQFKADSDADIRTLKSKEILHLNEYATAANCFDALLEKYELQAYAPADARNIASVRYEMTRTEFSGSIPYCFAEDVPDTLVLEIRENSERYPGVSETVVPKRAYLDGTLAPHVLGRSAALSPEEYEARKADGYRITDKIGKNGIEAAAESYLRGQDGLKYIEADPSGATRETYAREPVAGNHVILTLDANVQRAAQQALDESVAKVGGLRYASGAAVMVDVRNGEILACATNPRYDITQFAAQYAALQEDEKSPLLNRALQSAYAPGSSFKPGMALAGLEEGLFDRNSNPFAYACTRSYARYPNDGLKCLGHHDRLNVVDALKVSCNIFFYETGYYLGIERIDKYSEIYGFGQKTGVELPEAVGNISSPEYAQWMAEQIGSPVEEAWTAGQVVQTAIGQSYNMMTPLQMADYCMMLANGGTRYVPHLIRSVRTADFSRTLVDNSTPQVAYQYDFDPENIAVVHDGMSAMAHFERGAALNEGKLGEIGVCAKSGTPQVWRKDESGAMGWRNNCFLIAFAPKDDPQVALCAVVEDAPNSSYPIHVAKAMLEAYFGVGTQVVTAQPQEAGRLLG